MRVTLSCGRVFITADEKTRLTVASNGTGRAQLQVHEEDDEVLVNVTTDQLVEWAKRMLAHAGAEARDALLDRKNALLRRIRESGLQLPGELETAIEMEMVE